MDGTEILAGRYELGAVVGRGGAADVYRARDVLLSRDVAVKSLRDPASDPADRARFTGEARTLARLSHPGLVTLLDAGITHERPFLVMELVDGPTLSMLIAAGPLPPHRVAEIGAQLAGALGYVHARGVVHRDVKPGNVLVGPDDRVKLADFGIARLIGDTVHHTRTGHTIGTAAYLAPEQVLGGDITPATDVYALGLVLLEALTAVRAFPGTPTEAALARINVSPDVPTSLPARWRRLLRDMTSRQATDRPTAGAVAAALLAETRTPDPAPPDLESTVSMAPPTRTRLPTRPIPEAARRGRRTRSLAAVVVTALLLVALATAAGVRRQDDDASESTGTGSTPTGTPTNSPTTSASVAGSAVSSTPAPAASAAPTVRTKKHGKARHYKARHHTAGKKGKKGKKPPKGHGRGRH